MNIRIRTDIGGMHGMGHAVRMRALAQELVSSGATVSFLTSTEPLLSFVAPLPCQVKSPECLPLDADVFVVDTKEPWINAVLETVGGRKNTRTQVVRIDHPHATQDSCHLLIGPCAHWCPRTVTRLQKEFGPRFLYGWDYVMLAPEVTEQQPIPYEQRMRGPVGVCAGGSDPGKWLVHMAVWCQGMTATNQWIFLVPSMGTSALSGVPWVTVRPFERRYLREAALIIGLFGMMVYEALWWQTPMLMLGHTDENVEGADALMWASDKAVISIGDIRNHNARTFAACTEAFLPQSRMQYPADLPFMSFRGQDYLDGLGIQRIAEALMHL